MNTLALAAADNNKGVWGSPLNRSCAGHSVARGGSRGGGRCWAGARSLRAAVAAPCVAGVVLSAAGSGPGRDRRRVGVLAGRPVRGCVNGDGCTGSKTLPGSREVLDVPPALGGG